MHTFTGRGTRAGSRQRAQDTALCSRPRAPLVSLSVLSLSFSVSHTHAQCTRLLSSFPLSTITPDPSPHRKVSPHVTRGCDSRFGALEHTLRPWPLGRVRIHTQTLALGAAIAGRAQPVIHANMLTLTLAHAHAVSASLLQPEQGDKSAPPRPLHLNRVRPGFGKFTADLHLGCFKSKI